MKVTLASSFPLLNRRVIEVPCLAHMVRCRLNDLISTQNGNVHSKGSKGKGMVLILMHWPTIV